MVVGITIARTKFGSNAVGIPRSPGNHCAAILESSGSRGTRQRFAGDLVCAGEPGAERTLTLVLSLCQRERRPPPSQVESRNNDREERVNDAQPLAPRPNRCLPAATARLPELSRDKRPARNVA